MDSPAFRDKGQFFLPNQVFGNTHKNRDIVGSNRGHQQSLLVHLSGFPFLSFILYIIVYKMFILHQFS
jgi:hypothetical protein